LKSTFAITASVFTGFLCLTICDSARADETATHLLGDWGGIHSLLEERGLNLQANYVNEVSSNIAGGVERDTVYADQFFFGGSLDFERAIGLPGTKWVFSLSNRNGDNLAQKADLQTLLLVDEVWGQGSYTRLNQFYLEQTLFNSAIDLKFGRMTGSGDFMPFTCAFQNQTFCGTLPAYVVPNWVPFPGSTWAGILRVNFNGGFYAQAGAYEVNPAFARHQYTFAFGKPFGGQGERYVLEGGWISQNSEAPGAYRLGTWYDNVGGADLFLNEMGRPLALDGGSALQRSHQGGFYAMAQQRLWTGGTATVRTFDLFANLVQADSHVSLKDQIVEIGFFMKGALSWRPQDQVGFAVGRVHVSDQASAGQQLFNYEVAPILGLPEQAVQHAEYPAELFYSVAVTPAVSIQPNVQLIRAPGGVSGRSDVVILGLKSVVSF
jgi:porin